MEKFSKWMNAPFIVPRWFVIGYWFFLTMTYINFFATIFRN